MKQRFIRIGIDVGGTFTDAVALDHHTLEVVAKVKVPTTHEAPEGVTRGVVQAIHTVLEQARVGPEEVRFIAHGTTQATNALLEGDVACVGIISIARGGFEGWRARSETRLGRIQLAPGKWIETRHAFLDWPRDKDQLESAIAEIRQAGAAVLVAAAPYSVDDPSGELTVISAAQAAGLPATGTHEVSRLYGLRARTRTAVINASILPKMVATAEMTERAVRQGQIRAPLMVMRCDGGVMSVAEVKRRPIYTILSGPAAGVAGALMDEQIVDGIFLEVGGTSTDISCIRSGRVMLEYADVGGHRIYLRGLDVHTLGVGGGSMIRLSGRRVIQVGPRSAHIAGLPYACFARPEDLEDADLLLISPRPGDPSDYVVIRGRSGQLFALTLTCAANLAGYVPEGDYAHADHQAAVLGFAALARHLGVTPEEAAREVVAQAVRQVTPAVRALMKKYRLRDEDAILVGGGGGAATVVPAVANALRLPHRIARNAPYISTIGVALAMVRDVVERTIPNPRPEDLLEVRREAEEAALKAGAAPGSVEVEVEIDRARGVVRAVAVGATELRTRNTTHALDDRELDRRAAELLGMPTDACKRLAHTGRWTAYSGGTNNGPGPVCVLDEHGTPRVRSRRALLVTSPVADVLGRLAQTVTLTTRYGDAGAVLPHVHLFVGHRHIDLGQASKPEDIFALVQAEIEGYPPDMTVVTVCIPKEL